MTTDLTFITNEEGNKLSDRFKVLIKNTKFFDCLVGYFYKSGFHSIYKSLENTKKIRILIGISTNKETFDLLQKSRKESQKKLIISTKEIKDEYEKKVIEETENADDSIGTELGIEKFIEWIKSGKLEIKVYPDERIHAKLYIMTFDEGIPGVMDKGRVITGSSNLTEAGLNYNLEFNVELKNPHDYDFALKKFNELWENSIDVSQKYVETVKNKTWLNDELTPYELYLKFLYEYFKEKINLDKEEISGDYYPEDFLKLEYQEEAVNDAKTKLDEYGGVFLSDVVGLGKTYISAMLVKQLDGRTLVLAPPILLDENNPGSWKNVFFDFKIPAKFESIGNLSKVIDMGGLERYKNVIVDEAHRFRTEANITYEKLARICRGQRVILVSATPLNNSPKDILSQIKLFQKSKSSTIPNIRNLDNFFDGFQKRLKKLDRQKDYEEYMKLTKQNAKEIRERLLKYLIIRRTRGEIEKYFANDLKKNKLKFPDIIDPEQIFYEFNKREDEIFNKTIELITRKFNYARYKPLLYLERKPTQIEEISQTNMGKFMKILLVKRLESSFYAFKQSINRFMGYYSNAIDAYNKGYVFISKKYSEKIFEYLEAGDEYAIESLLEDKKAERYKSTDFRKEYINHLNEDLKILEEIHELWKNINRDPKLQKFIEILSSNDLLKGNKIILFTESKETAEYLWDSLHKSLQKKALVYSGGSTAETRNKVIENFDPRARNKKDDYRILISTEVLSEGVNLHRSNIVINYDIPWNPTRLMQRVGRINRIDTKFTKIYTFNFFPTQQSNDIIKLKEAAEAKIHAFIELLGADARLLTDGEEIKSHELFKRLTSKETILGEEEVEESELKYLGIIREIRDKQVDLFEKIKRLPKKARTSKKYVIDRNSLVTYFRKGKLQKFFLTNGNTTKELDFISAAKILSSKKEDKKATIKDDYYSFLQKNKEEFKKSTSEEKEEFIMKGGRDATTIILRILMSKQIKEFKGFTEDDEEYITKIEQLLKQGAFPRQTLKNLVKKLKKETNPLKVLAKLRITIPSEFFKETIAESAAKTSGPREVILSEYLIEEV